MKQKVKYLAMLMMAMMCSMFAACGSDDDEPDNQGSSGTTGKHEAVDLGLSVKWATTNVGAKTPSDYGDYFAWGETKPKSDYLIGNAQWLGFSYKELQSKGVTDANGNLTPEYDAATVNWGSNWRMPTKEEIRELFYSKKCTWTETTLNGRKGYRVTGPSGNSIFLPAVGCKDHGFYGGGSEGNYWSSTINDDDFAYELYFDIESAYQSWFTSAEFSFGFCVRPVTE